MNKVEEPILQRSLRGAHGEVSVVLGLPRKTEDGEDYYCPYSIEFAEETKVSYAIGVDSVQALQLTLKKIAVDLEYDCVPKVGSLSWLGDSGKTGFPFG